MKSTIHERLLQRELGTSTSYSRIRGIYGHRSWVDDLDIVNELGGHSGCVNALCWSKSGRLLASGSDDQHLNIYSYLPDSSASPFSLNTTVSTGHTANIFSVKFMPHSNDRTLVTCAGDSEVRIFDIEYTGQSTSASQHNESTSSIRSQRFNNFFNGVRYLNEGNANSRIYRSHADRVKRIVTESSPYLFLTCSEDGEVRQWDLRQPSSAYPAPRGGRGFMSYRTAREHDSSNVPPPLISYKRYHLDLNSISCSASQPHYIALGGAHLHCFLHDRRMLGRDVSAEEGRADTPTPIAGTHEDELMGQATRCVRRFAPHGQKRMKRTDNGHITACKISDANPNSLIVSWSGEHIYSFDLVQSPDAREAERLENERGPTRNELRIKKDLKRKRDKATSSTSLNSAGRGSSRPRQGVEQPGDEITLRVRYGNGQSEDIAVEPSSGQSNDPVAMVESARNEVLSEGQKLSYRLAEGLVKLRKTLFSLEASSRQASQTLSSLNLTSHTAAFTSALGYAATYLPLMDGVMRDWRYPVNPTEEQITFHQTMRKNRASVRRFMQASGTLARVSGGKLRTAGQGESPHLQLFKEIVPAPNEGTLIDKDSQFGYDFLKAILLWLEGGPAAILRGFKQQSDMRNDSRRFPIPETAGQEALDDILIPYLLRLSLSRPIVDIDASRFEANESRVLFETESAAVISFGNAIKIPLADLSRALMPASTAGAAIAFGDSGIQALDRSAALRFWGLKIGRSLLMRVGEDINFSFVNHAFGGIATSVVDDEEERSQQDIDPDEEEEVVESIRLVKSRTVGQAATNGIDEQEGAADEESAAGSRQNDTVQNQGSPADLDVEMARADSSVASTDTDSEGGDSDDASEGDNDDDDDGSISDPEERLIMRRSAFDRSKMREGVERHTPCSAHTNIYRGHCNVKTVKDVNFFGLDDEYVVSGSDSGHVFIWDRNTTQLVNILEGDGEVVNVVQGHPYEPMLAVSGIDSTIKIFSPDTRLQADARAGINIANPGHIHTSSLRFSSRRRPTPAVNENGTEDEDRGLTSRRRMQESYQITSQNDLDRRGGMSDAYITSGMLAQLAARLRARQATGETFDGDEATIVLDENCSVM